MNDLIPRFMDPAFQESEIFFAGSKEEQSFTRALSRDGVAVVDPHILDFDAVADEIVREITKLLPGPGRLQDAWRKIPAVRAVATNAHILRLLTFAYGRRPLPFQTLNFTVGTEQKTHSDTIHFDCFPRNFMCGVWVAFEDTDSGNGPLHYVPGSHRLPVLALEDFCIPRGTYGTRSEIYSRYEVALEAYISSLHLQKQTLSVRKGQAIVWAANAFHGGEPIQEPGRTRCSQVTHFYFDRCLYTQPLWSDLHGSRVMYKKVFDISADSYVPSWYNGRRFRLPMEAHIRSLAEVIRSYLRV